MNNLLPLILILSLTQKNSFSPDALPSLIKLLGVDDSSLKGLEELFKGGFSFEKLLPFALNLMGKTTSTKVQEDKKNSAEDASTTPNYLKPISNIANERINYALAHYFANV